MQNQDFKMPNGQLTSNIVAIKEGSNKPEEIVVVGAHFDSTSQNPSVSAPGAIDNGSGAVALLCLASALQGVQFDRTVHIVAFSGEEQGLFGSAHYVAEAKEKNADIIAALTMDMVSPHYQRL